jgi:hypothetical protein
VAQENTGVLLTPVVEVVVVVVLGTRLRAVPDLTVVLVVTVGVPEPTVVVTVVTAVMVLLVELVTVVVTTRVTVVVVIGVPVWTAFHGSVIRTQSTLAPDIPA